MTPAAVEIPPAEQALLERTARSMSAAGATLSGATRRSLAEASRSAAAERAAASETTPPSANDPLAEITHRMTVAPAEIRRSWVREQEQRGVSSANYVEILGLVSRLTAIDTFTFGLGTAAVDLRPADDNSEPTGRVADHATLSGGWVPTVGPASPPSALSLIPDEHEAMLDLHGVFYLSIPEMADLDADRGLHRTEMEFVAARTSLLNECFF
ncbi:MAG: hypothetical protein AAGA93_26475 [Actinomycetota bacterium]